jgi:hypothetical protein
MLVADLAANMTVSEYEYWIAYLLYKHEEQEREMRKARQESNQQVNTRPARRR